MDPETSQSASKSSLGGDSRARYQEGSSSLKILLAFVALIGVYFLFSQAGGLKPANVALGFVALWLIGAAVTLVLLAFSGKTRDKKSAAPVGDKKKAATVTPHPAMTKDLAA